MPSISMVFVTQEEYSDYGPVKLGSRYGISPSTLASYAFNNGLSRSRGSYNPKDVRAALHGRILEMAPTHANQGIADILNIPVTQVKHALAEAGVRRAGFWDAFIDVLEEAVRHTPNNKHARRYLNDRFPLEYQCIQAWRTPHLLRKKLTRVRGACLTHAKGDI